MGKQIVSPGVLKDIGELSDLTTTAKSSLVGAINEVNSKLSWTYINQLQTVNDSLQFPSDAKEILFVQYNSSGGTAFASLCIPNSSMPSAFAVYSDVGHAVISRSSSTLTLTENTNSSIIKVYYR